MKAITYHINGILETFKALKAGKFLMYFIPGAVITIIYLLTVDITSGYQDAVDLSTSYWWLDWFTGSIEKGVDGVFALIYIAFEQVYIFIVLTALSPFNTTLGERFDSYLTGMEFEFNFLRLINDFFRMIFIVILAITLEIIFLILYIVISWITGIPDVVDTFMYFIIAAFFFGFSFYDFALERYQQNVGSSLYYAFANPLMMILTGAIFLSIYHIPVVGIPISVVLVVMISTVAYLYSEKKLPKNELPAQEKNLNDV